MKNNIQEVLKRFDEKFPDAEYGWSGDGLDIPKDYALRPEEVKEFIQQEITKALEEQKKEIKLWVNKNKKGSESDDFTEGRFLGRYNQALLDLIKFLK